MPIFRSTLICCFAISISACVGQDWPTLGDNFAAPELHNKNTRIITADDLILINDIGAHRGSMFLSPDKTLVAFHMQQADLDQNNYRTGWFVKSIVGSNPAIHVGKGGDVVLAGEEVGRINGHILAPIAQWSPDSEWIVYRLKEGDQFQLWRSRYDGGRQEQLTKNAANIKTFQWDREGDKIFFTVGSPRNQIRKSINDESMKGFLFDDRFSPAYSTQPVHTFLLESPNDDESQTLWVYDIRAGLERLATKAEQRDYELSQKKTTTQHLAAERSISNLLSSKDEKQFAWFENENPETFSGYIPPMTLYAQLENGEEIRCPALECHGRLGRLFWNATEDEIIFLRQEGNNYLDHSIYAWKPKNGTLRNILSTDDLVSECELATGDLVCLHESWSTPRKIISIDTKSGRVATVFDPNPNFKNLDLTRVEELHWKEASGADAAGHLVYPVGYIEGKRYPLIVVQYRSSGFLRGGVGDEYPIHPLAAQGFFVLSFERPEKAHVYERIGDAWEFEREYWGPEIWERQSALSALEIVIEALDDRSLIDVSKVGITGLSDGAETVWYAMIHSDKFTAAAASSGGWSPTWYYLSTPDIRKNYYRYAADLSAPGMGSDDRWRQISPEFHAEEIDIPILVQVSDHELVGSAPSIAALEDAGQPIEAHVFPTEYHIKWQPKHKLMVYNRAIDWFNFWLRDVEDSDPEKTAQYERWRKMRDSKKRRHD